MPPWTHPVVLAGAGLLVLWFVLMIVDAAIHMSGYRAYAFQEFARTTAQILSAEVNHGAPAITYQYMHDGQTYTGQRFDFYETRAYGKRELEKIMTKHPVGASVDIRYDRKSPADAYIEMRDPPLSRWLGRLGLLCLIVGIPLLAAGLVMWGISIEQADAAGQAGQASGQ